MTIQGSIAALHFMITNAAKYDLDDTSLIQEILQLGLPKENTEAIAKQYREFKDQLRIKFADESYRVSRLISTDWRVDQILAASDSTIIQVILIFLILSLLIFNYIIIIIQKQREKIIHLKLNIDKSDKSVKSSNTSNDKVTNLAFEMTDTDLNVLIHELAQAQKLMENIA